MESFNFECLWIKWNRWLCNGCRGVTQIECLFRLSPQSTLHGHEFCLQVFPLVLEGLSVLCNHPEDSDLLLSTLLTLSSFLTDENYGLFYFYQMTLFQFQKLYICSCFICFVHSHRLESWLSSDGELRKNKEGIDVSFVYASYREGHCSRVRSGHGEEIDKSGPVSGFFGKCHHPPRS